MPKKLYLVIFWSQTFDHFKKSKAFLVTYSLYSPYWLLLILAQTFVTRFTFPISSAKSKALITVKDGICDTAATNVRNFCPLTEKQRGLLSETLSLTYSYRVCVPGSCSYYLWDGRGRTKRKKKKNLGPEKDFHALTDILIELHRKLSFGYTAATATATAQHVIVYASYSSSTCSTV